MTCCLSVGRQPTNQTLQTVLQLRAQTISIMLHLGKYIIFPRARGADRSAWYLAGIKRCEEFPGRCSSLLIAQ